MKTLAILVCVSLAGRASCSEPHRYDEPTTSSAAGADAATTAVATSAGGESTDQPESAGPASDAGAVRSHASVPTEIGARHLLVMYRGSQRAPEQITRTQDEARTRALEALRRARAGEDFVALVREFSDEPGAGTRGGSLGVFGHGSMVPAFERAAFRLDVGAISELVETPFGYHVIQRTQ